MPDPLSSDVVAQLRSDPTAALAASLILAGSFPELLAWAQRTIVPLAAKPNGHSPKGCAKANGALEANGAGRTSPHHGERFSSGPRTKGSHNPREAAAGHDQALLALMRANPDASVTELIRMSGRPRNSTQLSLERLEKAGLVEHGGRGRWVAVDPELLEVPTPKPAGWIEPLSGAHVAKHSAAMRVPDRVTAADA